VEFAEASMDCWWSKALLRVMVVRKDGFKLEGGGGELFKGVFTNFSKLE